MTCIFVIPPPTCAAPAKFNTRLSQLDFISLYVIASDVNFNTFSDAFEICYIIFKYRAKHSIIGNKIYKYKV